MSSSSGRRSAGRQSQSNSIATSSTSSPGHLPTTAASRARGNGNGGGARFEDFADSTVVTNADDTFGAAIKGKQRASAAQGDEDSIDEFAAAAATTAQPPAASSSSNTRRPRKTFNEVADDSGFVFTVESKRDAPSAAMGPPKIPASKSKANAPPPSTSRSKFISEPLPSDQVGETPINRRNRLFRGGPNLPSTPASRRTMSGSSSSAARRSSLNFKTSRRSSSLRDGSIAYPHPSVPDKELYRHCADNMPPVARMKHLAGWTLERARAEVLEATPSASTSSKRPTAPKGKRAATAAAAKGEEQAEEDSVWNAQEKKVLERCRPSLEKVMLDTLRDLSDQKINISWLAAAAAGKGAASSTPQPRPNPLNESNKALAEQLSSLVAALRSENARWEEERKAIEAFEEQTASMLGAGSAAAATAAGSSRDVTSSSNDAAASSSSTGKLAELDWTAEELDPAMARMMQDARRALALEEKWLPTAAGASNEAAAAASDTIATAVRAAAATKRKAYEEHLTLQRKGKRKSDMVPRPEGDDEETMIAGTDLDPRWRDVEYRADVLHSHTHIADRLSLLSSSYTSSISARAAQALRQLAFAPGDAAEGAAAAAGTSTSAAEQQRGSGGESAESRKAGRERLEKILRGVRESIGPVRRQEIQDEDAEAKAMEEAAAAEAAAAEVGGGGRGGRGAGADDSGVQLADQSHVDLLRAFASTKRSAPAAGAGGTAAGGSSKGRKSARSSRR